MVSSRSVVHIADYPASYTTNFISSILDLSRATRDALGFDTGIVFPESIQGRPVVRVVQDAGIFVDFIDKGKGHRERVRALERIGSAHRVVILHSHFGTFDVDVGLASLGLKCGAIWHMHSPYSKRETLRENAGEVAKLAAASRLIVSRIVAVSESVAESAVRHGAPPSKFVVVLNGIDTTRARPLGIPIRSALRRGYGISEEKIVFLLMGWPLERKGVDILVDAVNLLPPSVRRDSYCLVVNGRDDEATLARIIGGADNIRVIGPVEDVAELFALGDCFVSASRAEGLPYAIGEAMAANLPVISSDLPQVVAVYGPSTAGFLRFKTGDPGTLATAMSRLAAMTPSDRRRVGAENASFVRTHMSLDRWTDQILDVYRSLPAVARVRRETAERNGRS